jgi:bifunctional enzyme CysN/CysC
MSKPIKNLKDLKEQMKIVIVGHVDHGKSTLVGRLFYETDSLPEGKYEQIKAQSERRGMPFEWSFLMDALQSERDQGITIDTTQIWFKTKKRDYVIIDAPGHKEFLKNMVSGAASSDAALLIIDAEEGVKEQSKRHGYLLHLLGVSQVAVAINKMDLVNYSEERYKQIVQEYTQYLASIGVVAKFFIPISARQGDLITAQSSNMPWYDGVSVMGALDAFDLPKEVADMPLRLPVQDVYKFDERRIIAGRIEAGKLRVGDEITFSPTNRSVKVKSIEAWEGYRNITPPTEAHAGMSVGITLSEQIFAERGHIASHNLSAPVLTNIFRGRIFWLGNESLQVGSKYKMKISTSEYDIVVKEIERVVDTSDLAIRGEGAREVPKNAVAEVVFKIRGLAALDEFEANHKTGRFVLVQDFRIQGGGIIDMQGFSNQRRDVTPISQNLFPVEEKIDYKARAIANGHMGGVIWFTGLSGSGKTTLALELEKRLFMRGYQVTTLDGDNIRSGLNSDLSFTDADRKENMRRVGEVASLFANAGTIVITALISPFKTERDSARVASGGDKFHSVYIKADVKTCKARDVKGLYAKAETGQIENFTGVSSPFEEPENPDLVVDTVNSSIDECVQQLVNYIDKNLVAPVNVMEEQQEEFQASGI